MGSDPVTFTQLSGSNVAPLDTSLSYVEMVTHPDGNEDVMVNWMFDVNWNWDDVESIRWVSTALDAYGEFVWPAVSFSGQGNSKAVVVVIVARSKVVPLQPTATWVRNVSL